MPPERSDMLLFNYKGRWFSDFIDPTSTFPKVKMSHFFFFGGEGDAGVEVLKSDIISAFHLKLIIRSNNVNNWRAINININLSVLEL